MTGVQTCALPFFRPDVLERVRPRVARATEISPGRYALEIAATGRPEAVLADLAAAGAGIVSLNPLRDTLVDYFVRHVAEVGAGARAPVA